MFGHDKEGARYMKIFLIIVFTFFLLGIWGIGRFIRATSRLTKTADAFFDAVRRRDMSKAFSCFSEEFRAGTNERELQKFLSESALLNFKKASWPNRSVATGGRGELSGTVTTETDGTIPLKLTFMKENGIWRIYSVHKPVAGLDHPTLMSTQDSYAIPGKAELVRLVKQSMHDFVVSLNSKSMEYFRSTVSRTWQHQLPTEGFTAIYGMLLQTGIDLGCLEGLDPFISVNSGIDEAGVIRLQGHYILADGKIQFEHKYLNEGYAWKLIGFNIEFKRVTTRFGSADSARWN